MRDFNYNTDLRNYLYVTDSLSLHTYFVAPEKPNPVLGMPSRAVFREWMLLIEYDVLNRYCSLEFL